MNSDDGSMAECILDDANWDPISKCFCGEFMVSIRGNADPPVWTIHCDQCDIATKERVHLSEATSEWNALITALKVVEVL